MIDRNKLYSLVLSLVVLFSALAGNARRGSSDEVVYTATLEATTVTASAKDTIIPEAPRAVVVQRPAPKISAASALVKRINSTDEFFISHPNQQWPVASLTKLMTAVVALEKINATSSVKVSSEAIATEGGAGNLIAGKFYSRRELLGALLKVSSNDAGVALAEYVGTEEFVQLMNQRAISIGMYNTRYFDPTGLSALNQSMVSDLEKLVIYIFNVHPEIFAITREVGGNIHPFVNQPNFIGGKTGFIDEASGNLISLFHSPSAGQTQPLLIIVLGSEDRTKDTEALYNTYTKW